MKLLDLPLELVQSIIETTVQDLGLRPSVKLREVCKTFDNEVMRSYETLFIFAFDKNTKIVCRGKESHWRGDWARPIIPFLARFIERRPYEGNWRPTKDGLKLWETSLPCLLNRILDDLSIVAEDRFDALVTLLEHHGEEHHYMQLYGGVTPAVIFDLEFGSYAPLRPEEPSILGSLSQHKGTAAFLLKTEETHSQRLRSLGNNNLNMTLELATWGAISTGQDSLVRKLYSQWPSTSSGYSDPVWIDPLVAAARTNNMDMAQLIVQLEFAKKGPMCRERLEKAITHSSQLGNLAMAELLISTAISEYGSIECFGDGARVAMRRSTLLGNISFMQLLHSHGASLDTGYHHDLIPSIGIASWKGDIAVLKWITDNLESRKIEHIQNALTAAVHGNKVESLRLLVDRHMPKCVNLDSPWWHWDMMIEEGIRLRSYRAVRYLLEEIQVIDMGPCLWATPFPYGHIVSITAAGGHLEMLEMLIRLGVLLNEPYPIFFRGADNLSTHVTWTPIMHAQASAEPDARLIEHRLYELGIKPVDMMQADFLEDFEWFRQQPLYFYESRMPVSLLVKKVNRELARDVLYINGANPASHSHDTYG